MILFILPSPFFGGGVENTTCYELILLPYKTCSSQPVFSHLGGNKLLYENPPGVLDCFTWVARVLVFVNSPLLCVLVDARHWLTSARTWFFCRCDQTSS